MRSRLAMLALAAVCSVAGGCHRSEPKSDLERGREVFAKSCAGCHGPHGSGGQRAGFDRPPPDLSDAEFQRSRTDAELLSVVRNGRGQMPAFSRSLRDQDIRRVVSYLRTLPGQR